MKLCFTLCLGFSMLAGFYLNAVPVKKGCHCVDCKCTTEAHCGCYSKEGCSGHDCNCNEESH